MHDDDILPETSSRFSQFISNSPPPTQQYYPPVAQGYTPAPDYAAYPSPSSSSSSQPLKRSFYDVEQDQYNPYAYAQPPPPAPAPIPAQSSPPAPAQHPEPRRPSGACTRCKKMKMKCEFLPATPHICQRCKAAASSPGGAAPQCVVEGRKPRTPSHRESLLAQIRAREARIAALLAKLRTQGAAEGTITLAASRLPAGEVGTEERAALAWVERYPLVGGGVVLAAGGAGGTLAKTREKKAARAGGGGGVKDEPGDEEWSEDSLSGSEHDEDEDDAAALAWDEDAERRARALGIASGAKNGDGMLVSGAPVANAPAGLVARMSLKAPPEGETNPLAEFYQAGVSANLPLRRVMNERETPPAPIASGLIDWNEARALFKIFFDYMNPYMSLLDKAIHSTSSVAQRCPFLFTVVCATASRFYAPRTQLYLPLMHLAKAGAASALVDAPKTVELVQAYLLLAVYGLPARRWEEDRSWFYGGMAIRMATDLGLDQPSSWSLPPPSGRKKGGKKDEALSAAHARELLNRKRTWLVVFNIDRSTATQFGKPSLIRAEDPMPERTASTRRSPGSGLVLSGEDGAKGWYKSSEHNHPYDVHLVAYTELLRIMWRWRELVLEATTPNVDLEAMTQQTERELDAWNEDVHWRYSVRPQQEKDQGIQVREAGVPVFENYMRLVMYSFAFHKAWKTRTLKPGDMWFMKCMNAASKVIRTLIDVHVPSGYLKYAPDCFFVMGGFSSAFLLKILRPEFSALVDEYQRQRIFTLVETFIKHIDSPQVAMSTQHTPKLYARFLHVQVLHARQAQAAQAQAPLVSPVESSTTATGGAPGGPDAAPFSPCTMSTSSSSGGSPSAVATPRWGSPDAGAIFHAQTGESMPSLSGAFAAFSEFGSEAETAVPATEGKEAQGDAAAAWWNVSPGPSTNEHASDGEDYRMELCEDEVLASMRSVSFSSEEWLNTMLMPGFKESSAMCVEFVGGGGGGGGDGGGGGAAAFTFDSWLADDPTVGV